MKGKGSKPSHFCSLACSSSSSKPGTNKETWWNDCLQMVMEMETHIRKSHRLRLDGACYDSSVWFSKALYTRLGASMKAQDKIITCIWQTGERTTYIERLIAKYIFLRNGRKKIHKCRQSANVHISGFWRTILIPFSWIEIRIRLVQLVKVVGFLCTSFLILLLNVMRLAR